jgi:magnesium and cobalt transporter
MNDDPDSRPPHSRSWLERITHVFAREPHDRAELISLLQDAKERELLDPDAFAMMQGVLQVSEMRVRDVMVPRSQMVIIEQDAPLEKILPIVIESSHSRFPVIGESRDEVIGILLAKDLLNYAMPIKGTNNPFDIHKTLRTPVFVPESKRLDVLLREFRNTHNHMALVVDEYGGIAGIVTIEDVLEQIVGEIEDEHDINEEPDIKKIAEQKYVVKALTPIEEFNKYFNEKISDEEYDTVGGLVMSTFGSLPKRGDVIKFGRYQFKVLHADKRRLSVLQVKIIND